MERIALVLRCALLRGLAGLGAGLLAVSVLWGGLLLMGGLLQGNALSRSLFGDATHVPMFCIGATLALLLAWEEWAEPLVRRFWALLLPLLLVLGIILAAVVLFLSNEQLDSLITAAAGLSIIAASLLFAAGTRREPGLFTAFSRLASLPMVLLAGWLLEQAIVRNGWQSGYLHICLITTSVLLASARAWIVHFRPGLWLPEGTVTMLLPLIALVGMLQDPIPQIGPMEADATPLELQVVWPVGAAVPEGVASTFKEPYRCMPTRVCRLLLQDLDGDGEIEVVNLDHGYILKKRGEEWVHGGSVFSEADDQHTESKYVTSRPGVPTEDIQSVETVEPKFKDLLINGKRVRVSLY